MTDHVARLYALALAVVVFFVSWAAIAARPWQRAAADPRLALLAQRDAQLEREAALVRRVVAAQHRRTAAAPAVRIVNLPPLTITRTS